MARVLLLIPTASYRSADFLDAADRLGVDVLVGSDQEAVLESLSGGAAFAVDFDDPERGASEIAARTAARPVDAVVAVDGAGNLLAARAAEMLGLTHNPPAAVGRTRNKYRFREALAAAGAPHPAFRLVPLDADAGRIAREVGYPCVLKPLSLAMSRGVIRADGHNSFVDAFHRVAAIIAQPDAATPGEAADHLLVESYVPGTEYALEGLIVEGRFRLLAVFDKPDPLEGPYFEETIYVTPAQVSGAERAAMIAGAQAAIDAVGLRDGPTHIDLRVNDQGVVILEVDARSIGGRCGRSLRFGDGMRLEEVILRHALGLPIESLDQAAAAGGVMMIPIPASGILRGVEGLEEASAIRGIEEVTISIALGHPVLELPEGGKYLGFIIGRGPQPEDVIASLRRAHAALRFEIEP